MPSRNLFIIRSMNIVVTVNIGLFALLINCQEQELNENCFIKGLYYQELGQLEDSILWSDKCLQVNPKDDLSYYIKASSLFLLKQYNDTLEAIDQAILFEQKQDTYYQLKGRVLLELSRYEESMRMFDVAIEINPQEPMYYAFRGKLYYELSNPQEALQEYMQALKLDSKNDQYYYQAAQCNYLLGNSRAALELVDLAMRINPKNDHYYFLKGLCLQSIFEHARAIKNLDMAIKIKRDIAIYHDLKGQSHYQLEEYRQALEAFERALELEPKDDYYYAISKCLYEMGEYEDAFVVIDELTINNPNEAKYHGRKGQILQALKLYEESLASLAGAIELNPQESSFHYFQGCQLDQQIAQIYYLLQQYDKAVKKCNDAIHANPEEITFVYLKESSLIKLGHAQQHSTNNTNTGSNNIAKNYITFRLKHMNQRELSYVQVFTYTILNYFCYLTTNESSLIVTHLPQLGLLNEIRLTDGTITSIYQYIRRHSFARMLYPYQGISTYIGDDQGIIAYIFELLPRNQTKQHLELLFGREYINALPDIDKLLIDVTLAAINLEEGSPYENIQGIDFQKLFEHLRIQLSRDGRQDIIINIAVFDREACYQALSDVRRILSCLGSNKYEHHETTNIFLNAVDCQIREFVDDL